jgi:uncharacterized membrane protein
MVDDVVATEDEETPLEEAVGGAVMALTFLVGFGLLVADASFFWVAFPVGFAGVLPMAIGLVKLYQRNQTGTDDRSDETEDALAELRQRYARGELTDEEFEQQVETLLETESVGDARAYADRGRDDRSEENREPDFE